MSELLWNRMLDDALKGNIVCQKFSIRYDDIVIPLKKLGWTDNCLEWNYMYNDCLNLSVISIGDNFELIMTKI